ncbi:MAG TPA: chaperone modulator CbpM [Burkholderiales bacterium]|nr:chaperone modulator CbpM [Burkholderiales bacterium]
MQVELTEAVWLDERGSVTLVELSQCSGLTQEELRDLMDLGAIEPIDAAATEPSFGAQCIVAARTACRLRDDFELDPQGLALVLSLLERVQELEDALQRLNARLPRMPR